MLKFFGSSQRSVPSSRPINSPVDAAAREAKIWQDGGMLWNRVPFLGYWRREWDSNPRRHHCLAGFQDRCLKPLGHPSGFGSASEQNRRLRHIDTRSPTPLPFVRLPRQLDPGAPTGIRPTSQSGTNSGGFFRCETKPTIHLAGLETREGDRCRSSALSFL